MNDFGISFRPALAIVMVMLVIQAAMPGEPSRCALRFFGEADGGNYGTATYVEHGGNRYLLIAYHNLYRKTSAGG